MNVTLTTNKDRFIENNVPYFGGEYISSTQIFPTIDWNNIYYWHNEENNTLNAVKILAFAFGRTSDYKAKIFTLAQFSDRIEWRDDIVIAGAITKHIFKSKEDYFQYAASSGRYAENIFDYIPIKSVLPDYSYAAVVGFKYHCFEWKNSKADYTNDITIDYFLVTKDGVFACVSGKYGQKIYISKKECLKEHFNTMVINDFTETKTEPFGFNINPITPSKKRVAIIEMEC